jgi:hypothetical protein
MSTDGETLKLFIDNQPKAKIKIANELGISKQALFGYFKSRELSPDTKKKFEDYFKKSIFGHLPKVNISVANERPITGDSTEPLHLAILAIAESNKGLVRANTAIAEANKILAEKVPESATGETQPDVGSILIGLQELIVDLGMGRYWKDRNEGQQAVHNRIYGHLKKKKVEGSRSS